MVSKKLHERKPNRYHGFDYSTHGCYFVTVCLKKNADISFWNREQTSEWIKSTEKHFTSFAPGATHFEFLNYEKLLENLPLSREGKIAKEMLGNIESSYPGVKVRISTIMPDHVHMLIHHMSNDEIDLSRILGMYKRAVSIAVGKSVWQKSFYDTIITHNTQYDNIFEYIYRNPLKYLHKTPEVKSFLNSEQ